MIHADSDVAAAMLATVARTAPLLGSRQISGRQSPGPARLK
jgi:hypothetical protein